MRAGGVSSVSQTGEFEEEERRGKREELNSTIDRKVPSKKET